MHMARERRSRTLVSRSPGPSAEAADGHNHHHRLQPYVNGDLEVTTALERSAVVPKTDGGRQEGQHIIHADEGGNIDNANLQRQLALSERPVENVNLPWGQRSKMQPRWRDSSSAWPTAVWDAAPAILNPLASLAENVAALFQAGAAFAAGDEACDAETEGGAPWASEPHKTGRLVLRWLELENFKSFQGRHVVGPFSNCVAIAGPNGAGKSNLFEAVAFALGVNARQLRCARLIDLLSTSPSSDVGGAAAEEARANAGGGPNAEELTASVTLHFVAAGAAAGQQMRGVSTPRFSEATQPCRPTRSFRRTLTRKGVEFYFVDGEKVSPAAYRACLQKDCCCSLHTLQAMLIFQGQIDAVALKTPRELARLFEEISGSAVYAERYEAAQATLQKARDDAQRLFCRCSQLQQELKVLRKQKAEADGYLRQKQEQRRLQEEAYLFRFYVAESIQTVEKDQQQHAEQQQLEHREQLEKLLIEAQEADRQKITKELELQHAKENVARMASRSHELRGTCMALLERARFREQQREELQRQQAKLTAQREELHEYEEQLLQQSVKAAERMREAEARVKAAEERCVTAHQQQNSLQKQRLTPEQQQLLQRLEISWEQQHALEQQRIAARQLQLKALRSSFDLVQEEEREMARSESSANELYQETAAKAATVREALQQVLVRAHSVKEGLDELRNLIATAEEQRHSLGLLQEELQQQITQERNLVIDMRRVAHDREVCAQLKKHVSHTGVHAAAIECCQPLNKRLTVAVAAALGERANCIIVENHDLATRCIDYLKTMRLGSREFLPLETLRGHRYKCVTAIHGATGGEPNSYEQWRQPEFLANDDYDEEEQISHTLPPPPMDELPPGCRWAVDCVIFEDKLRPAFEFLLSDCIIVPTLTVAQQLRYGQNSECYMGGEYFTRSKGLQRYRMVTMEGEKLLRSGVIAFESGGLVARLAARWESQQQLRLVERLRNVREQLEALEVAETTNSEKLLQRTAEFGALHRQSVQLQAKARVWGEQAEEKQQALLQLRQQLHQQQQRVAALREDIRVKQQQMDEMQSNLQQLNQLHFAPLDRCVGRKHVRQEEQRSQQLLEQYRSEAASITKQQQELQAELGDCRDRLQQLQQKQEQLMGGVHHERQQEEEQRLLRQLQVAEDEVAAADRQSEAAAAEYKKIKDQLRSTTDNLQKIRERVETRQAEHRRLVRVAAAALIREQQAAEERRKLLEEVVQQDIQLPLSVGTWKAVRTAVLGKEAATASATQEGDTIANEQDLLDTSSPLNKSAEKGGSTTESDACEDVVEKRRRRNCRERRRNSSNTSGDTADAVMRKDSAMENEEKSDSQMQLDSACGLQQQADNTGDQAEKDEKHPFQFDFSKLPADKRQLVSRSVQQGLTSVLEEEKEKYHHQLKLQTALLRQLQPNLKADEQQQNLQQELQGLEQHRETCRNCAAAAEEELQQLQGCRSALFLRCFHHCRAAVDFFFRELTSHTSASIDTSCLEYEGESTKTRSGISSSRAAPPSAAAATTAGTDSVEAAIPGAAGLQPRQQLALVDQSVSRSPLQKNQIYLNRRFRESGRPGALDKIGGRAFLELEPLTTENTDAATVLPSREDEAFLCGVSLLCMPPAKRILPLHLLSGGERSAAAVSLLLALLSFLPRAPFLLLDEVDEALDISRRKALSRVLHAVAQQLQVLFISLKDQMYATASMMVGVVVERPLRRSRCFLLDLLPYRKKRSGHRSETCDGPRRGGGGLPAVAPDVTMGLPTAATPASARPSSRGASEGTDGLAPEYTPLTEDRSIAAEFRSGSSRYRDPGSSLLSSLASSKLGQSRSTFSRRGSTMDVSSSKRHPLANDIETMLSPKSQKTSLPQHS